MPALAELRLRSPLAARGLSGTSRMPGRAHEREGVWHRPAVLNLFSDVLMLFAAVAFGYALVAWFLSRPLFPLREVVVLTPPAQVTTEQLEYVARSAIRGNFFSVDLETVRETFEKLPWVRRAEVRRRWPDVLELRLEEHQAAAYWTVSESGDSQLVNRQGEVFVAASNAELPSFSGPQGSAAYIQAKHREFGAMLEPLGRKLVGLALSAREAWQLKLDDGMVIMLGRDQEKAPIGERLERFVSAWPQAKEKVGVQVAVADLRYPSGFALTPVGDFKAAKGKQ
ncbi:cell division protein FtsQ/DivIB [Aromatoleum toluolicum]|uniref:Cell division protein FtsQ n=1 Tax=Aromatoleum toluolicum TaxID=90060 RepID=A0ABX1NF06_9RHOO|nr:cell division protein FtsQ/DivIB [Aromatoleum toluolicum]NMF97851.1 cell division protein FtsQ/DivIB [Aromatoleum toluolicum]